MIFSSPPRQVSFGSLLGLLCCLAFGTRPTWGESTREDIYRAARQTAVEILVDGHHSGSGCMVTADGHVATAAHVVGRPDRKVEILVADGTRHTAQLVAVDLGHDVMVLRIPERTGGYAHVELADSLPAVGSEVLLCSSAAYRRILLQPGTIARDDLTFEFQDHFIEVTQVTALIQEGTSGGGWLNPKGQLIGIQSGAITVKGHPAGIANVAPVSAVKRLLATSANASSATIGAFVDEIWLLSPEQLRRYPQGTQGVVIQSLTSDGPATRAGIRKGDVITACQGQPFRYRDDFLRTIRASKPSDTIQLTVLRPDGAGITQVVVDIGRLEVSYERHDL